MGIRMRSNIGGWKQYKREGSVLQNAPSGLLKKNQKDLGRPRDILLLI